MLAASCADGVILVHEIGKIPRDALRRCQEQLTGAKTNVLGVVLNKLTALELEPRSLAYDTYRYYSDGEPKSPAKSFEGV